VNKGGGSIGEGSEGVEYISTQKRVMGDGWGLICMMYREQKTVTSNP